MQGEPHHNLTFLKQAEVRRRSCRIIHERKNIGSKLAQIVDFVIAFAVQRAPEVAHWVPGLAKC